MLSAGPTQTERGDSCPLPRRRAIAAVFLGLLALVAAPVLRAASLDYGDLTLSEEPTPVMVGSHGYCEIALRIRNSGRATREVTLTVRAHPMAEGLGRLSRTVSVGPGASRIVRLWVPPLPFYASGEAAVRIDGRPQSKPFPIILTTGRLAYMGSGAATISVLLDRRLPQDAVEGALVPSSERPSHIAMSSREREVTPVRAETAVSGWSPAWLSYTPFDAIVVRTDSFTTAPGPVREAITRFTTAGGILILVGPGTVPASLERFPADSAAGLRSFSVGAGTLLRCPSADVLADPATARYVIAHLNRSAAVWERVSSSQNARRDFPVIDNDSFPLAGIFVIMLLFALLAGPVNILLLARFNRRLWLFWTTPALALFTSVAILLYVLLAEGIYSRVRIEGVTLLDQGSKQAVTFGMNGFYCPVPPRGGLRYGYDTEATPRISLGRHFSGGNDRTIDWSDGQSLIAGWVSPRIPAYFCLRTCETRNERLAVEELPDGKLEVVNGLGAGITELTVRSGAGRLYRFGPIAAGSRAAADPEATPEAATGNLPVDLFISANWKHDATRRGTQLPTFGSYYAVLDGAPFVENGLPGASRVRESSAVYGLLEAAEGTP